MFFRVTTIKRGEKRYQYGHIAESYRRESDGKPVQRIIAKLGALTDLQVETFQTAFAAMRKGQRVALVDGSAPLPETTLSLEYLDCAVVLALWKSWGLDELFRQLIPDPSASVAAADVIATLVCQRCVAPGSKLSATRWAPRTAIPELLGFAPEAMNNSRVHRVLDQLSSVEDAVQSALPHRFQADGAFVALYLDTTDAVFEGEGPPRAARSRWKDGVVRRRVAIPLLCDQRGFPLRWDVLDGNSADNVTFVDVVKQLQSCSWARQLPIVMDRAAGSSATIGQLLETELPFLTALRKTEYPTYAPDIPYEGLVELDEQDDDEALSRAAAERIAQSGFQRVSDTLLVKDLGLVTPRRVSVRTRNRGAGRSATVDTKAARRCREALLLTQQATAAVQSGAVPSFNAYCEAKGVSASVLKKYRKLEQLTPTLQQAVLERRYTPASLAELIAAAALPCDEQEALLNRSDSAPTASSARTETKEEVLPTVRCVLYFNPALFVQKRRNASARLRRFEAVIEKLNTSLGKRKRKLPAVTASIDAALERAKLSDIYDYEIRANAKGIQHVSLKRRGEQWAHRRRFDGFSLLVGHPTLKHTGLELCHLYRSRELIEYDFRTIKSFVELAPVRHRLEQKVRAHVTICMLALLLERTLDARLHDMTAPAALERLQTCRLNRFGDQLYGLTRATTEQRRLIESLGLEQLLDATDVTSQILPR